MTDYNKLTVHGRVVRNAEMAKTENGLVIVRFSIGSNRVRKLKDGSYADEPSFFPVAIFGDYAERLFPRLIRGQGLTVEGRIKQQRWEKDGEKRNEIIICVEKIYFDAFISKEGKENEKPDFGENRENTDNMWVASAGGEEAAAEYPPEEFFENVEIF